MAFGIYTHEKCLEHNPGPGHPECFERLEGIINALRLSQLKDRLTLIQANEASEEQLLLAHTLEHIQHIKQSAPAAGRISLDADTSMSPGSLEAALRGAGAACQAVDDIMNGDVATAFCATRPPGHHATPSQAMGFCIFNNLAIAALYAQKEYNLNKIAILDFDVHHGNGTQDILRGREGILYISTHQSPLYPGSGHQHENVTNNILNIPLEAGFSHNAYKTLLTEEIIPVLDNYQPDFLMVSAGFDAHMQDPLAGLSFTESTYQVLGKELKTLALKVCQGRLLSVLEGGYNLQVLGNSVNNYIAGQLNSKK